MGTPGVSSLIDQVRSWRVPMPLSQSLAWLQAHHPRGLRDDGSDSAGGPGGITLVGYGYAGQGSPARESAELEIAGAPAGTGGGDVRADGAGGGPGPDPGPDTRAGPPMAAMVGGGRPG